MTGDRSISLWVHQFDGPLADATMRALTFVGSGRVLCVVGLTVAVWALWRKQRLLAALMVGVGITAETLNVLLKLFFARPRPQLFFEIIAPKSYSFPSGHAMLSTAVYGMAALVLAHMHPRFRLPLYVGAALLVLLIGLSRVFLGVHWPSDVLGGFAVGAILLVVGAEFARASAREG